MAASRRSRLILLLSVCFILVTLVVVFFLIRYPNFARQQVVEQLIFRNGSFQLSNFHSTEELKSLRVTFYLFNVTNVYDVINNNAKIRLQEIGPFTYHEIKIKDFIINDQQNGLITYKLRKQFYFDASLSVGDPKTMQLTWPNVPLLAAQAMLENLPFFEREPALWAIETAIKALDEPAFLTDTVERLLFEGSHRAIFAGLQKLDIIKFFNPWPLKDNKFGILYGKNDSWDPQRDYTYTMSTGFGPNQTYKNLNQFVYINGSSSLPFWYYDPPGCNQLYGTDGEFFAPFMGQPSELQVYSMDICRKLTLRFSQKAVLKGLQLHKYVLDGRSWQSVEKRQENKCYCLQRGSLAGDLKPECSLDGLIDLSNCVAPNVVASGVHFFNGSKQLLERIDGLDPPDERLHEPYAFIEPNTGLTINVRIPLQLNARLKKGGFKIFDFYQSDESLIIPLLSVIESAELDDTQAAQLRNKLLLLDSWLVSMILGGTMFFVLALFVIGCSSYSERRRRRRGSLEKIAGICDNSNESRNEDDNEDDIWSTDNTTKRSSKQDHETEPLVINSSKKKHPPKYYQSL